LAFVRDELIANPADVLESSQNLKPIFGKISCAIGCSDNDPCTIDSCDEATGQCKFTNSTSDRDGDGVVDCKDSCNGNDALLGSACSETNGTCTFSGAFECGATGDIVCRSSDNIVSGCCSFLRTDVSAPLGEIQLQRQQINESFKKTVRALRRKRLRFGKAFKAYLAVSQQADLAVSTIPTIFSQCNEAVSVSVCPSVAESGNYQSITSEVKQARRLVRIIRKKARQENVSKKALNSLRVVAKVAKIIQAELGKLPATRSACL
jgi:hypothetical protein